MGETSRYDSFWSKFLSTYGSVDLEISYLFPKYRYGIDISIPKKGYVDKIKASAILSAFEVQQGKFH